MSLPKEPTFFALEYENGLDYYLKKYFSHVSGQRILGDAGLTNFYLPYVVPRIKKCAPPDAKFLVILRHPVDRAYSNWRHRTTLGWEKRPFAEAIEENIKELKTRPFPASEQESVLYQKTFDHKATYNPYFPPPYMYIGFYDEHIQRYISAFSVEQVKILFLPDLKRDPARVMSDIFNFIGVGTSCAIDYSAKNEAYTAEELKIRNFIDRTVPTLKLFLKPWLKPLRAGIRKCFGENKKEDKIPDDLRRKLIDLYEPHTAALERMTGRSLEAWRK